MIKAANNTRDRKARVKPVIPACATGYRKMEARAMIEKAIVWRLNLFLSITHQNPNRIAKPVKRLINMTKIPV